MVAGHVFHHVGYLADCVQTLSASLVLLEFIPVILVPAFVYVHESVSNLHLHALVLEPGVLGERGTPHELPLTYGAPVPLHLVAVLFPLVQLRNGAVLVNKLRLVPPLARGDVCADQVLRVSRLPRIILVCVGSSHVHQHTSFIII